MRNILFLFFFGCSTGPQLETLNPSFHMAEDSCEPGEYVSFEFPEEPPWWNVRFKYEGGFYRFPANNTNTSRTQVLYQNRINFYCPNELQKVEFEEQISGPVEGYKVVWMEQ